MTRYSVRRKITFLFILICVVFMLLGYVWYQQSTALIRKHTVNYSQEMIVQMNGRLDAYFADIENLSLPLATHALTTQFLQYTGNDPYERLIVTKAVDQLFNTVMLGRSEIVGMSIVSEAGFAVSSYSNLFAQQRFEDYAAQIAVLGEFRLLGISYHNNLPMMVMAMKFRNPDANQVALLIIDVRLDPLIEVTGKARLGQSGFAWLADARGRYLYHPQPGKWGELVPRDYAGQAPTLQGAYAEGYLYDGDILVTYGRSAATGLTLYLEVPLSELHADLVTLRNITLIVGLGVWLVSLLAILSVFFSFSNSILRLQRAMKRVEGGNLEVKIHTRQQDEVGELYGSFNKMIGEVRTLLQTVGAYRLKEKELEIKRKDSHLQALQYQINPHFLFNTLELINAYAIVDDQRHISKIVNALARIFRYNVEHHAKTVALSVEIAHIKDYLSIQAERFEMLQVELGVDEQDATQVMGMPLIVQPLVENAFKHGYTGHKRFPSYIGIHGEKGPEGYCLYVQDHGCGMPAERMAQYNHRFAVDEDSQGYEAEKLGLWNVHSRIRLTFGAPYGLHIVRSDHEGTSVRLLLPCRSACGSQQPIMRTGRDKSPT